MPRLLKSITFKNISPSENVLGSLQVLSFLWFYCGPFLPSSSSLFVFPLSPIGACHHSSTLGCIDCVFALSYFTKRIKA